MENLYEGENIKIGGKEYVVPGLSFGQIERLSDTIEEIQKAGAGGKLDKALIRKVSEVAHAALSRNYPEISLEQVKDMLDTRNMKTVFAAIMGESGFVAAKGGNGAAGAPLKSA